MAGMKITDLDFLRLLPSFMREDEAVQALSRAMDRLLGAPGKKVHTISTWASIDELTEAECDEMAWELDIDWYDNSVSLEEKRETIKSAQQIKRKRGTKWAVERLIGLHFGEGWIMEWYESGDAPYTCKILTTTTNVTAENYAEFVASANAAKNERSRITGIYYLWLQGEKSAIETALASSLHRYDMPPCGTVDEVATLGAVVRASIETEPEVAHYRYDIDQVGDCHCGDDGEAATLGGAIVGTAIVDVSVIRC